MRPWHLIAAVALAACGARDFPGADFDAAPPVGFRDAGPDGAVGPTPDAGAETPLLFVDLVDPPDGAVLGGDFDVFARPNRVDGVRVRFWLDDVMLGLADAPPYTVRVRVADFAPGPHTLRAVARDAAGARVEDAVQVTFGRDDGPPAIRFVAPGEGEVLTGPTEVAVATRGDVGEVRFFADGADLGRFRDGRFAWTPPYVHAVHELRAVGRGAEASMHVEVDHPTRVEMTRCVEDGCGPAVDGERLDGVVEFAAAIMDDEPVEVVHVEIYLDERFFDEPGGLPAAWIWDLGGFAPGEHHIRVTAFLADGREVHGRASFLVAAGDDLAPAAYVSWLDIPADPTSARRAGCTVPGANAGSGLGSLAGLFGEPYGGAVTPGPDGRIPHLLLAHIADWPRGAPAAALRGIDLRMLAGRHDPPAMWVDRASFPGGDPSLPPLARYERTGVAGAEFLTSPIPRSVGLPPVLGRWRPLFLASSTVGGELVDGMTGFGLAPARFQGLWTEAEILATIADIQAACARGEAPAECDFWAGVVPPDSHPRDVLPILLGLVGGYDTRWNGRAGEACDPSRRDDCNAIGVCILGEMSEAVVAGVAP
jgi:hypothetical protein